MGIGFPAFLAVISLPVEITSARVEGRWKRRIHAVDVAIDVPRFGFDVFFAVGWHRQAGAIVPQEILDG